MKCREVTMIWPCRNEEVAEKNKEMPAKKQLDSYGGLYWKGPSLSVYFLYSLRHVRRLMIPISIVHKLKYRVVCLNTERLPETNWENKTCDGSSCNVYIMNAMAQLSSGIQKRRSFSALMDVFFILSQHAIFLLD